MIKRAMNNRRNKKQQEAESDIFIDINVIPVNGYKMVTGLLWQPLNNPRNYMAEARSLGKKHNMDIVAVRTGRHCQAGFVSKNNGVNKTMYSMAATLSGFLGDDWIGIFPIKEQDETKEKKYVFVAVAEGSIVPGCDMVGDYVEVLMKAEQTSIMFTDENPMDIYAPKEFEQLGIKDFYELDEIITAANIKKEYRLRALQFGLSRDEWILVSLLATIVVIALALFHLWYQKQQEKHRLEEIRRQAEFEEMQKRSRAALLKTALAHPWAKTSTATDFIQRCNYSVDQLPLSIGGWIFSDAACKPTGVEIKYTNTGVSSVNELMQELQAQGVTAAIDENGNTASMTLPINVPASDENIAPVSDRLNDFFSMFQEIGLPMNLQKQPDPAPPVQADPSQPPLPPPDWVSFKFKVDTEIEPNMIFKHENDKGVRIETYTVKLDKNRLVYGVEGNVYAKK